MKRLFSLMTILLAMSLVLGVTGCSDDDDNPATPSTTDEFKLVAELGDTYFTTYETPNGKGVNTTAEAVWNLLSDMDTTNDPYIMDWRSAADYALGHIEGAVNVSLGNFEAALDDIPAGKTVLNVCYTGQSASHATAYMNMLGISAQNLKFGMCGWTSDTAINKSKWDNAVSDDFTTWMTTTDYTTTTTHEYPELSTGKSTAEEILRARASEYLASGWHTISATALFEDIEVNGNADDYFIVNYFDSATYAAGHIPGAFQFTPKLSLREDESLELLPTDKKIVVYCYTGQTSSQVVAYLSALGYDAYSLLYGVNGMCFSNDDICKTKYHVAATDYPVVR